MSEVKDLIAEDIELFDAIHREEMRNVPNRKTMHSQILSQRALAPAIVKFINHKLMNQGTKNVRSNKRSNSKKDQDQSTSDS